MENLNKNQIDALNEEGLRNALTERENILEDEKAELENLKTEARKIEGVNPETDTESNERLEKLETSRQEYAEKYREVFVKKNWFSQQINTLKEKLGTKANRLDEKDFSDELKTTKDNYTNSKIEYYKNLIDTTAPKDEQAAFIYKELVVGEREKLDALQRELFQENNIFHKSWNSLKGATPESIKKTLALTGKGLRYGFDAYRKIPRNVRIGLIVAGTFAISGGVAAAVKGVRMGTGYVTGSSIAKEGMKYENKLNTKLTATNENAEKEAMSEMSGEDWVEFFSDKKNLAKQEQIEAERIKTSRKIYSKKLAAKIATTGLALGAGFAAGYGSGKLTEAGMNHLEATGIFNNQTTLTGNIPLRGTEMPVHETAPADTTHVEIKPIETPHEAPTHPEIKPTTDALVQNKEGITYPLARQIEHDEALAKSLNWDGKEDLHKFAARAAYEQAKLHGYVDANGHEVRVYADKGAAYQFRLDTNHKIVGVEEFKDGEFSEFHETGSVFEDQDHAEGYEYSNNDVHHYSTNTHHDIGPENKINTPLVNEKINDGGVPDTEGAPLIDEVSGTALPIGSSYIGADGKLHNFFQQHPPEVNAKTHTDTANTTHTDTPKAETPKMSDETFSEAVIAKADKVFRHDINLYFGKHFGVSWGGANDEAWLGIKDLNASNWMYEHDIDGGGLVESDERLTQFWNHLQILQDDTGIKPGINETITHYFKRMLETNANIALAEKAVEN